MGAPCCSPAHWLWWAEQLPPAPRCGEGESLTFLASPVKSCPCSHPGVGLSDSPQQPSDGRSWRGGLKGTCPPAADRTGEKLMGFSSSPISSGVCVSEPFTVSVLRTSAHDRHRAASLSCLCLWEHRPALQRSALFPLDVNSQPRGSRRPAF